MTSPEEEWWIVRCGEYVLGTLRGPDLVQFERIVDADAGLRAEVVRWERRLQPLHDSTVSVIPPARVWQGIETHVRKQLADQKEQRRQQSAARADEPTAAAAAINTGRSQPRFLWPAVAALATAASLLFATLLSQQSVPQPADPFSVDGISLVLNEEDSPLWFVQTDFTHSTVRVTALAPPPIDADDDFHLWQVLPDDAGVRSVGVLPEGSGLTRAIVVDGLTEDFTLFAVSVEPQGGSPDLSPSGPVKYRGSFFYMRDSR